MHLRYNEKIHTLTPNGATCRNSTFWMTVTSASHISFIQSLFLTKILELDFNSKLVSREKISAQSKMICRFGMRFSARGSSFGLYLQ